MVSTLRQGRSTWKQLSLSKNLQVENKTAQITINSNSLSYVAKPLRQTTQDQKIPVTKKVQPSRLSDQLKYRSNFRSSNYTILVAVSSSLLSSYFRPLGGKSRKAGEKTKPDLHRSPCPPSRGNSHPCRTAKPPKAKIVTNYHFVKVNCR